MKKLKVLALLLIAATAITSCDKCSTIEDAGNPRRLIRVQDKGQNLWFGSNAQYDPNEAKLIHEREGELPITVVQDEQGIQVRFPLTAESEEQMTLQLDSATSVDFTYASIEFEMDCEKEYELSYVLVEGDKICGICDEDRAIVIPVE